jgi:tRNA threonylcarbamoyladenosine biosynthesis protein TsaE
MVHIVNLNNIDLFTKQIIELLINNNINILLLSGDLGSGKTTFTKSLARNLNIKDDISSPTFVLMKKYKIKGNLFEELVHIDAYRVEDQTLFENLNLVSVLENKTSLFSVEWPEYITEIEKYPYIKIKFDYKSENERQLTISIKNG